jgi:hypothetical protein
LYNITRKLPGKGFSRNNKPVRNKKGEILSTQEQQLQRWREHFSEILNREQEQEPQRQEEENISERNVQPDPRINLDPPIRAEVRAAIKQMKSRKAPGTDNISPEVLKVDIETSVDMLHPLFEKMKRRKSSKGKKV